MISNRHAEGNFGFDIKLPQQTLSLCPECLKVLPATIYEQDNRVWMRKFCEEHGECIELISSDAEFFLKLDKYNWQFRGGADWPITISNNNCPNDCGICSLHKSTPVFINIDLTNRCNLRCPVCFANAAVSGKVYELSLSEIERLVNLPFKVSKTGPSCIQFSGGEPTIHPNFLDAIKLAKKAGYAQIQIASNGLKFARDASFARAASDAGLNVVYLQFDGLDDEVYLKTRGRKLLELKEQALENIYKAGMSVCLVPTLIKGVNDNQIGKILNYAITHIDEIVGISWQPVAFTGRIDFKKRLEMRFTLADLARELEVQTDGRIKMHRDWYPLSFVLPFSKLIEAITGEEQIKISCHNHCGAGTYIVVDRKTKDYRAIPEFVDVEGLMLKMEKLANLLETRRWFKQFTLARAMNDLDRFFYPDKSLPGLTASKLMEFMMSFIDFKKKYPDNSARLADMRNSRFRWLLLVSMHFQDVYNYELPRVQRCVIQYAAADGRLYPFCTYNCGPCFRERVEAKHSREFTNADMPVIFEGTIGKRLVSSETIQNR